MNLRVKVFLSTGGVLAVFLFLSYGIFSAVIADEFRDLEKQSVEEDVNRAADALQNRIDDLVVKISDWGQWDDTYGFIQDRNPEYLRANLYDVTLELLRIQFVVITDRNGDIIFKKQVDQSGKSIEFSKNYEEYFREHHFLFEHQDAKNLHAGIANIPEGAIVTVARAVTSSDGAAPVNGTIVFAFFIDEGVEQKIAELTHLNVTLSNYNQASEPGLIQAAQNLPSEGSVYVGPRNDTDKTVFGYALKNDIDGNKAIIVGVEHDRDLFRRGQQNIVLFSRTIFGFGILMLTMVLLLFEFLVLRRLFFLSQAVEKVSQSRDGAIDISLPGKDEFSALAKRINQMLLFLREVEAKRKESERRFRTVADSAPVMIWMSDLEKKCTYVNKVWLDYTGKTLAEELGLGWKNEVHPDDQKAIDHHYETAFAAEKAFSTEYRLRRSDGEYRWVFSRAIPHLSAEGVFLGYIGSCVDISERKEAEAQKQRYIEEIEKTNQVMIERELKMIELKEKIKMLEGHDIKKN